MHSDDDYDYRHRELYPRTGEEHYSRRSAEERRRIPEYDRERAQERRELLEIDILRRESAENELQRRMERSRLHELEGQREHNRGSSHELDVELRLTSSSTQRREQAHQRDHGGRPGRRQGRANTRGRARGCGRGRGRGRGHRHASTHEPAPGHAQESRKERLQRLAHEHFLRNSDFTEDERRIVSHNLALLRAHHFPTGTNTQQREPVVDRQATQEEAPPTSSSTPIASQPVDNAAVSPVQASFKPEAHQADGEDQGEVAVTSQVSDQPLTSNTTASILPDPDPATVLDVTPEPDYVHKLKQFVLATTRCHDIVTMQMARQLVLNEQKLITLPIFYQTQKGLQAATGKIAVTSGDHPSRC